MRNVNTLKKQSGAALVIGLLLLVVITVLAISGMNTATTELAIARNNQGYENAFQAAETGLEQSISQGTFSTTNTVTLTQTVPGTNDTVTTTIECVDETIVPPPDRAFSLGNGKGISAYHYLATSQAESRRSGGGPTDRDSSARHTQSFYIVGPESGNLTGPGC